MSGGRATRIGAALALVAVLALPGVARAADVTLAGDPLNVTVDGLGHVDVSYDGVSQLFGEGWDGFALSTGNTTSFAGDREGRVLDAQSQPDPLTATSSWHLADVAGLQVDERDSIAPESHDLTRVFTLTNTGDTPIDVRAGELADSSVGDEDAGRGVLTPGSPRLVGGISGDGQLNGLVENSDSRWSSWEEANYGDLEADFSSGGLRDSVDPETTDNGFAAEWDLTLPPDSSRTITAIWRFDAAARVTTTDDGDDGSCAPDDCTLREALLYGDNALISVPRGTYRLSRELQLPGDATFAIYGAGAGGDGSVIDGGAATRLFEVDNGANVLVSGLRLQDGNGTSISYAPRRAAAETLVNGDGGAIAVQQGGTLALADSEVVHNTAAAEGGGIANAGTLTLLRSTVAENVTGDDEDPSGTALGGGLYLTGADTTLLDATVGQNRADGQGGGIAVSGGTLRLESTTVARNAATGAAGALQIGDAAVSAVNTILAGDTPQECAGGPLNGSDYDIVGDRSCAPDGTHNQQGADPLLAPLAINQPADEDIDDTVQIRTYAPDKGSPAIAAGSGEDCAAGDLEGMDALGQPRLQDDGCTIGAVERYVLPAPTIASPADGATVPAQPITFSGTAAPGTSVAVSSADSGDTADVDTGADGHWTLQFPAQDPGRYTFVATAFDDTGVESEPSAPVTLTVAGFPAPDAQVSGSTVTLSGTAAPGDAVTVLDAGTVVATVTANADGAWTAVLTGVSPGTHSYSYVAGDAPQSAPRTVTVAAPQGTTPTPTPTATPSATATPTPTPPPVAGKTLDTHVKSGTIKVRLPHSNRYVTLAPGQQLPVGSTVDATHGRITLLAAGGQQADFYSGLFKISQTKGAKPLTTLTLAGPKPTCPRGRTASAAAKKKKVKSRSLWGSGHGSFRTTGQYSSATVRGTTWFTQDSCAGTLTRVTAGVVQVQDFVHHRKRLVRAGHRYLARRR